MDDVKLFQEKSGAVFRLLGDYKVGALATSVHDHPSVRSVSCIFINGEIFFQTDRMMAKAGQIRQNNDVAICFDNIQISGVCEDIGHPFSPANSDVYSLFQKSYPKAAAKYSGMANECFFKITPYFIQSWAYCDGEPHIEVIDYKKKQYRLQKYI